MSGRLPEVTIEGPPYERGYQYGRKCRDRIMVSVEAYRRMMASYAGLDWEEALRRAREYELPILRYDPEILEEMSGLAAGCDLPLAVVLVLKARNGFTLTPGRPWSGYTAAAPEASESLRGIQAVLTDHTSYPSLICRHPDAERRGIFRLGSGLFTGMS